MTFEGFISKRDSNGKKFEKEKSSSLHSFNEPKNGCDDNEPEMKENWDDELEVLPFKESSNSSNYVRNEKTGGILPSQALASDLGATKSGHNLEAPEAVPPHEPFDEYKEVCFQKSLEHLASQILYACKFIFSQGNINICRARFW